MMLEMKNAPSGKIKKDRQAVTLQSYKIFRGEIRKRIFFIFRIQLPLTPQIQDPGYGHENRKEALISEQ